MGEIVIASFYTTNTPYEKIVKDFLIKSCNKLNLKYNVKAVENLHSWSKNVAQKPFVILELLRELEDNKVLVFLDADATLEQSLKDFNIEYDIAAHYLDWDTWYQNNSGTKELLSGTLFFRNSQKVRDLVSEWYRRAITTNFWEQKVLEELLKERKDIKVFDLPIEYCYIKSLPDGREPFIKCIPVIVHHQVSRQMKRIIK